MKHKKEKSTLSFKYLNNRHFKEHHTEQQQIFKTDIQHKLDLLRLPVYKKKAKTKTPSSTKYILPQREKIKRQIRPSTRKQLHNEQQNINVSQHYKYKKICKSGFGNVLNSRDTYNKTAAELKFKKKQESTLQDKDEKEPSKFYQVIRSATKLHQVQYHPHKQITYRDSQSLLRKSSLYLSTFVKRKQKEQQEKPHIAYIPNVAQNIKIKTSPKKQYQYNKNISKQIKRLKQKKRKTDSAQKIFNNMPIDPW